MVFTKIEHASNYTSITSGHKCIIIVQWSSLSWFQLLDLLIWNYCGNLTVSLTLFVLVYSKRSSNWRSKNTLRLPSMFKLKWENLSDQSVSVTLVDWISRALYQISTSLLHVLALFLQSCNFNHNNYSYYHNCCWYYHNNHYYW